MFLVCLFGLRPKHDTGKVVPLEGQIRALSQMESLVTLSFTGSLGYNYNCLDGGHQSSNSEHVNKVSLDTLNA